MQQRQVSRRALIARINYRLDKDGQQLYSSRSALDIAKHGEGSFFIAEQETGAVIKGISSAKALEQYARELGAMKPAEALASD